jgi:predicted transcriptional regulator
VPKGHHNGKRGPKRTRKERELDKPTIISLMRRGWTQQMIADELGLDRTMVTYEWAKIRAQMAAQMDTDVKEIIGATLEELAEVKRESWHGWDKSKRRGKKKTTEVSSSGNSEREKESTTVEARTGDPRFLQAILNCIQSERELRGIDAPKSVDARVLTLNWDELVKQLPPEVVDDIEARIAAVSAPAPPELPNGESNAPPTSNGESHS